MCAGAPPPKAEVFSAGSPLQDAAVASGDGDTHASKGHIMKIALLGQFGSGNSGNDGSLEAAVKFLRKHLPTAELVCICSDPSPIERKLRIRAISISSQPFRDARLRRLNAVLHHLPQRLASLWAAFQGTRGLDVMMVPGTGILDDFHDSPFGWPFVLFRWCLAARLAGAHVAFVSIGAGPIHSRLSRWFLKAAASLATYLSFRDQGSRDFMRGIGIDVAGESVYPDIAFALPVPTGSPSRPRQVSTVGIGVMSYFGWTKDNPNGSLIYNDYLDKLQVFVLWLLDRGFGVRLLTGDVSDWRAVEALCDRIEAHAGVAVRRRIEAEPGRTLHDVMAQIATTDVVVATRFHNVVCAL
jgi:polysaccharide pyruvyl transferase WcaK-like protein